MPSQLSAASSFTITVAYATSAGTATAGSDYTSTSGTLTFAPGQTSLNISIPILNDVTVETNETINLTLSSPTNATLGSPNPATLTILDDDGVPPSTDEVDRYDTLGNLRTKGAATYTYGATASSCVSGTLTGKPHAVVTAGAASYTYDCNGNILTGGGRTMTWDTENRPTQVVSGTVTETYGYDADGERIGRTVAGVTTVYLGGLWEETSSGNVKQYYTFNGAMVAVRDSSAGVTYLHSDHLGSVSVTTDASGALASRQFFGPWGNLLSGGISATSHNYTGQYLDSGTGLLYYHARYYDPVLARFVSADSVVPGQGDKAGTTNPQSLNRYSYVDNNPITHNDPTGHCGTIGVAATAISVMSGDCTRRAWEGIGHAQSLGDKALLGFVAGASAIGFAAGWAGATLGAVAGAAPAVAAAGEAAGMSAGTIAASQLAVGNAVMSTGGSIAGQLASTGTIDPTSTAVAAGTGLLTGGASLAVKTLGGAIALGGVSNTAQYVATQMLNGDSITGSDLLTNATAGAIGGLIGGTSSLPAHPYAVGGISAIFKQRFSDLNFGIGSATKNFLSAIGTNSNLPTYIRDRFGSQ